MINRQNYKDVQQYLDYKVKVRKVTQHSLTVYRTWLNHALDWCGETPFGTCSSKKETFNDYILMKIKNKELARYTGHSICKNFRQFLFYMKDEEPSRYGKLKNSFIKSIEIKNPVDLTKRVRVYSYDDIIRISNLDIPENDLSLRRVQAAVCFMYLSGMRIGACVTMPIKAVHLDILKVSQSPAIGVHTKYSKSAVTALYNKHPMIDVVKKWDDFMRQNYSLDNYWYPRLNGRKKIKPGMPITDDVDKSYADTRNVTRTFYTNLKKLCNMAGVEYQSSHACRYGHILFGMTNSSNVKDFKTVSQNVMHGSLAITDTIYSRMNIDTVNENISNMGNKDKDISNSNLEELIKRAVEEAFKNQRTDGMV